MIDYKTLSEKLSVLGFSPYSEKSYYSPRRNAQQNLTGRTHYVDDDTLKYFHARDLTADHVQNGLVFYIVESAAGDMRNTNRIFRFVAFNILGEVIERPRIEHSFKNKEKATRAFWAWLNEFDTRAHYADILTRKAKRAQTEAAELLNIAGLMGVENV